MKKALGVKRVPYDTSTIRNMKNADGTKMGASGTDCCGNYAGGCSSGGRGRSSGSAH